MQTHDSGKLDLWLRRQEVESPSIDNWRQALEEIAPFLQLSLPIAETERVELVLKRVLRMVLSQDLDGASARFVARFQRDLGFTIKYKSYAIKCTSPLGYAIFLQNPGQGFSFQRHLTRKTETFHILAALDGAKVFLCSSEEWESAYEVGRFSRWLAGESDPAFDRHNLVPRGGDVFHVDRLGIVHSVLGCILEEFATVSVDMVDRLHDQNADRVASFDVSRSDVEERLRHLPVPRVCAQFQPGREKEGRRAVLPTVRDGVASFVLATGEVDAVRYVIEAGVATPPERERERAVAVFVQAGRGELLLGDETELAGGLPAMDIVAGDLLLIAPNMFRGFVAVGDEGLVVAEHRIRPALALD